MVCNDVRREASAQGLCCFLLNDSCPEDSCPDAESQQGGRRLGRSADVGTDGVGSQCSVVTVSGGAIRIMRAGREARLALQLNATG